MTMQVEDPMSEWVRPPARYTEMAATYREALGTHPFSIDINVVPVHWKGQPGFPSEQPTGLEFLLQWRAAQARTEYVTFYAENSVYAEDWALLPATIAAEARITAGADADTLFLATAGMIRTSAPVTLLSEGADAPVRLPAGIVLLPPGTHLVHREGGTPSGRERLLRPRLRPLRGTVEVRAIAYTDQSVLLRYRSRSRMPVTFNLRPARVRVDGAPVHAPMFTNQEGTVVFLPPGEHRAELELDTAAR
jgi:hypothetical protein